MTRPGSTAPTATPYGVMRGYRAALEQYLELRFTADRIGETRYAVADLLREKSLRILLDAAEGGARLEPERRQRFYGSALSGTGDLHGLIDTAVALRVYPGEVRLGADTVIRMAEQALAIAVGMMWEERGRAERLE